jgi:hypothetical protein
VTRPAPGFDELCRKYRGAFSLEEIEEYWLEERDKLHENVGEVVENDGKNVQSWRFK